jgi:hypothetical protein
MPKKRTDAPRTAKRRLVVTFKQCKSPNGDRRSEDGPYFIKHWREGGRTRREIVPWQEVIATFKALERERG